LSFAEFLALKLIVQASCPPLYQPGAVSEHKISKLWETQLSITDCFWRHLSQGWTPRTSQHL